MNKSVGKLVIIFLSSIILLACTPRDKYVLISGYAQGGTYSVKLNLKGETAGEEGCKDVMIKLSPEQLKHDIDSLLVLFDNTLSGYNENSLLSCFNRGERIVPNEIFLDIYRMSYGFYQSTGGAFDVAAGPLFDIWGFGFKGDSFPTDEQVREVAANCGMGRLVADVESVMAGDRSLCAVDLLSDETLRDAAAKDSGLLPNLNYNAIAQGYACDIVAEYLHGIGVRDMLVDIGGEIYCSGMNPSRQPWKIGVDKPVDGSNVRGAEMEGVLSSEGRSCGIVTSGNYRKFYIKDGRKYAHSIDPRSAYPVSHSLLSATVIAADAATADALATYCMVIGYEDAKDFLKSDPELEGYLIYEEDGIMKTWSSSGL